MTMNNLSWALPQSTASCNASFYVRIVSIPETKRKRTEAEQFEFAKDHLYQRCLDILDDASRCGLGGHRLDDFELIRYYQSCVHTHYAQKYPLEEINTVGLDRPLRAISTGRDQGDWGGGRNDSPRRG